MNEFEKLMNNGNYWANLNVDSILIENGDIIEEEYTITMKTNVKDSIKIFLNKRYNRKYINARKYKIKDKRIVYQKAHCSSKIDYFNKDLVSKNVVFLEKETLVKTEEEKVYKKIIPEEIYMKINFCGHIRELSGLFEMTETNFWFTIISLDKEIGETIFKSSIVEISRKSKLDLIFEREIYLSRSNLYVDKKISGKVYFYNKLVKNKFVKNIYVGWPKRINDLWWFEETQINFRKQEEKFLDQIEKDYYEEYLT